MTLTKAFVERKRLTNEFAKISSKLADIPLWFEVGKQEEEATAQSFDEDYKKLVEFSEVISELNAEIDKANGNSQARKIIAEITATRNLLGITESFEKDAKHFVATKEIFDNYKYNENGERGTYVTHNYKMSSSMDFEKMVKEYRKKIHKLEDQLAEENAKTIVELSEELEEHIFKLLEE